MSVQQHVWEKSVLGHGDLMCSRCKVTDREAGALGEMNICMWVDPPASSADLQQRQGRDADIILEALNAYSEWLLDDDHAAMGAFSQIMHRMRDRYGASGRELPRIAAETDTGSAPKTPSPTAIGGEALVPTALSRAQADKIARMWGCTLDEADETYEAMLEVVSRPALSSRILSLEAEKKALIEGLRPFAEWWRHAGGERFRDGPILTTWDSTNITNENFDQASRLLSGVEGEK